MAGICSECGEQCSEEYKVISEVSYSYRDRNITDREWGYGSNCCGAEVIQEEEKDECLTQ